MKPNERQREFHSMVRSHSGLRSLNVTERDWSYILHDENWWGDDPEKCPCGAPATHKWNGKGVCRAHLDSIMAEVDADSKPLIGRYDRTKRYRPGLTDCVSRVTASLPRRALAEAVVAMDVTSRQLIVVRV